ncbi:Checkpoint protein HUS1 [Fukomys damarensis]|uniref:Checkpoint protein n=1 Tax=Fukomys damarensis TaxID=885580 RepID=A0A091ECI7_FUKDA|nr:Checkpoint protein HUS1 [Fukomys damarensis]
MKFRAKIVDAACLNHFTRVSNMIAKLAKICTLRISPEKLNFILCDRLAGGGVSTWCELEQENFFSEFQMEGISAENNVIYLELTSENLSRALKTAQNARTLKFKLTNKHFPCLTVSVELLSMSSSSRIVTHDIPLNVIPRKLWKDFQQPSVPEAEVSIYLPVLKTLKSVVEKMKNISNHLETCCVFHGTDLLVLTVSCILNKQSVSLFFLGAGVGLRPWAPCVTGVGCGLVNLPSIISGSTLRKWPSCTVRLQRPVRWVIEANLNGELNLKIETDLVCVTTHFKDLGNPSLASDDASRDRDPAEMAEVHVDIRKLLQFLVGQQVNPTRALCNIVSGRVVHLDLLYEDVSLQYFIPALA